MLCSNVIFVLNKEPQTPQKNVKCKHKYREFKIYKGV